MNEFHPGSARRHRRNSAIAVCAFLLTAAGLLWRGPVPPETSSGASDTAIALLAAPAADAFARAHTPTDFSFPRDHGAHPDFRTEWWYFTGHLQDAQRREYGFQLTLFRFELDAGVAADHDPAASAWRTPRVMLGHFALSDLAGGRFHAFERLSRAVPGIAGALTAPPRIWVDDWEIGFDKNTWQLQAAQDDIALTLALDADAAIVRQGEQGLSRKSASAGNASYYYSMPHLAGHGQLKLNGQVLEVHAHAWLDREWSTSALDKNQQGWDWFALQLDDGASLMFYRLRLAGGRTDPLSAGTFVDADGRITRLAAGDVMLTATAHWLSPATGIRYPAAWRLEIGPANKVLEIKPRLAQQEWTRGFRYWEGAVSVSSGGAVVGRGYVELTGYQTQSASP